MDGYPIDHIPDRPSKRDEKVMLKQMGDMADFVAELDRTHYWCNVKNDFIPRQPETAA